MAGEHDTILVHSLSTVGLILKVYKAERLSFQLQVGQTPGFRISFLFCVDW
jgi:hypothetical protein